MTWDRVDRVVVAALRITIALTLVAICAGIVVALWRAVLGGA
jgi:flagellar biosynthesis protein FliQ